jgi:hypothetical protein
MSRSKEGTLNSDDPNYTLRSLRRNQYSGENFSAFGQNQLPVGSIQAGEPGIILEDSEEQVKSIEDLDPDNFENNFKEEKVDESQGKYFNVVKTFTKENFMNTDSSMTTAQIEFLRNTLEKTNKGSQLSKEDLDQVELLNLQFLKA